MYGGAFDGMFTVFAVVFALIGAAIVGVAFWLIPWLWALAKPWLHAVTG